MPPRVPYQMQTFLLILVLCIGVPILVHLIITPPVFTQNLLPCPPFNYSSRNYHVTSTIPNDAADSHYRPNCPAIFARDGEEIRQAKQYRWCTQTDAITAEKYTDLAQDCKVLRESMGFDDYPISKEEKDFPIAFSILMFEQVEQTMRLLRAIYRPQNLYCIHVDKKSTRSVRKAMAAVTECFDNVILASHPVFVTWSEFPVLQAEIECMKDLWAHKTKWKYFINLTGREFPLKTNKELVEILKAYQGGNDIDGTLHK